MKTLIVPDIHGHFNTLQGLLSEAGVLDDQNNRVDGWRVIQLGDLANCVKEDIHGDLACLQKVGDWIDTMLVGNHEHPYWGGPEFSGFWPYPDIAMELRRIDNKGHLAPAALVGAEDDILVTHAGFVPTEGVESALEGFNFATEKWHEDRKGPLFSQIGASRGGWSAVGGILWSGWEEQKAHEFNQIVGHTPQKKGVDRRDYASGRWSICIDIGAKRGRGATGVVLDEDGEMAFVETEMSGNHSFW